MARKKSQNMGKQGFRQQQHDVSYLASKIHRKKSRGDQEPATGGLFVSHACNAC